MWQSQVEIEHYSVAYFYRITMFKALQRRTSVKGEAHTHCVNVVSFQFHSAFEPPHLTEILRYSASNAVMR